MILTLRGSTRGKYGNLTTGLLRKADPGSICWLMEPHRQMVAQQEVSFTVFVQDEADKLTDERFIVIGDLGERRRRHGWAAMLWCFNHACALAFYWSLRFGVVGDSWTA